MHTNKDIAFMLIAIGLGLLFASLAMGCADMHAYKDGEYHHYSKDGQKWSH